MADEMETREVLAAIKLAYPTRFQLDPDPKILKATVDLWHGLLSDLPDAAALNACRALVASSVHPPAISEIRSEALGVRLAKGRHEAGEAWGEVVKAIGQVGRNKIPEWSSPAITMAVRAIGGWVRICNSENSVSDRAQFIRHFEGMLNAAERDVLTNKAESIEAALELRAPASKTRAALLPVGVPRVSTAAEAEELFGKGSKTALDLAERLTKRGLGR